MGKFTIEKGLTITPDELVKLTEAELRAIAKPLIDASNKRIIRLKEKGILWKSEAFMGLEETGLISEKTGKITMPRSMTRNQILNRLVSARNFINYKTSSVTGVEKMEKEMEERGLPEFPNEYQEKKFWKAYREALGNHSRTDLMKKMGANDSVQLISKMKTEVFDKGKKNISWRELASRMDSAMTDIYESSQIDEETDENDPFNEKVLL